HLSDHRRACVRFDRHTVYLGTPPLNQECPSLLVGTTEAMLIAPASRGAAPVSVENKVARRITVVSHRMRITATFGTRPQVIDRILASAHLPRPVRPLTKASSALAAPSAATVPRLPARATAFHGRGFERMTAIFYDMEGYPPWQSARVLRFLSAWSIRLRALGFYSGVYSSSSSGVADLARQYGRGRYAMPDVIWDALWNGRANTLDS